MAGKEPKPNVAKRAVKVIGKHVNVKRAARALDQMVDEEAPREQSADRRADSSVVAPTPMGGLSCIVRVAELLGFAGVAVTASAALVGRCRR